MTGYDLFQEEDSEWEDSSEEDEEMRNMISARHVLSESEWIESDEDEAAYDNNDRINLIIHTGFNSLLTGHY